MSNDIPNASAMMIELNASIANLGAKLDTLSSGITDLKTDLESMSGDISKIKEAMYNPDKGLYARHAQLEARIQQLESWKASNTKVVWSIVSLTIALDMNSIWGMITTAP